MMKKIQNSKFKIQNFSRHGFTIVELLIYMGILSVLLFVLTGIFVSVLDVQTESEATASVEQDERYLLAKMSSDINRASSITSPAGNGTTSNNLGLTIGGISYTYSLDGNGNLTLTIGATAYQLNGYDTAISSSGPIFTRLGNPGQKEDTITINFTIKSQTIKKSGEESRDFKTTVARRRNN